MAINAFLPMTAFAGAAVREVLRVIGDPLPVIVVLHRRPDSLLAVVGLHRLVTLAGKVDIQRGYNVSVVVTNQDGIHLAAPLPVYFRT